MIIKYQFPVGKVEVLSKSVSDWLTVPMQQRSKKTSQRRSLIG